MTQAAGKLNHRIRLWSIDTTQDSDGEAIEEWTDQGQVWAEVAPLSAREFVSSAAMQSRIVVRITIRRREDIQANWLIEFRGRYYNIEGVLSDPVSGMEYQTLPCSEGIDVRPVMPWDYSLPGLVEFISENYDQPNPHNQPVMSSPPVITLATSTPAQFTKYFSHDDPADYFAYSGGADFTNTGGARQFPVATRFSSGGNITGGLDGTMWRARAYVDAQQVGIRIGGSASIPYRFIVDGQFVSLAGTLSPQTGTNRYFVLTFGSKQERLIELESEQHLAFFAYATANADTVSQSAQPARRMLILGDSFTVGNAATRGADGFSRVAGDMLGLYDTWSSGVTGTGYVATNSGTRYRLGERLQDANTTGPWDVIVVAMGVNDRPFPAASITEQVSTCLQSIRAANRSAQIFVVGPWDSAAPSAPASDYVACRAAIIAGIPERLGIRFIDAQGVAYAKADSLHPNTAGHKTLGDWLALQIKTMLEA